MNIQFQIIDISSDDIPDDPNNFWERSFVMTFYGKTIQNENVVCNVIGYKPYFYVRIPDNWSTSKVRLFLKIIHQFIQSYKPGNRMIWNGTYDEELLECGKYNNFYGYNYDQFCDKIKMYNFAKIYFDNYGNCRKCISAIQDFFKVNLSHSKNNKICLGYNKKQPILNNINDKLNLSDWFNQDHNCDCIANLYEAKIHPMLRFLHEKNIQSCGWVEVTIPNQSFLTDEDSKQFNVDLEINNLPLRYIQPINIDSTARFITASFDIECDSSHGDFPNPTKDFKKLAIDIHESYFRTSKNCDPLLIKQKFIEKCIIDAFNNGSNDVLNIFTINGPYSEKSLKETLSQFDDNFFELLDSSKETTKKREHIINLLTEILNNMKNNNNEPILIKGDPIIQIGTVFHRYGDKECYDRSIIVIGNEDIPGEKICDDIDNVNVYCCDSEKELLLKWKDLLLHHNPDILTGYNIFGFDFDYINKRVNYLFPCTDKCKKNKSYSNCAFNCPKNDFYRLGRLMRNRVSDRIKSMDEIIPSKVSQKSYGNFWEKRCQIVKKELSSSGLGDNILHYISMDGRVIFDIQKEIQKGHSLDSYKLDNVSAHFMKGKIRTQTRFKGKQMNINFLYTTNVGNLKVNDYITINLHTKYGTLRYKNGKKFQIKQIGMAKKIIGIDETIYIKKYRKDLLFYEWCLCKDDVSPQQIFDFHKKGGSEGRAKIAKYCIMDCELCIHLLLLLDLIPNNIGMANVSSVPLSYIFLRGQGIKISSLVTKVCSEKKTRIPTLKNFNENKLDDGFEGAIVLEPDPGIYLDDPVAVLDYASLYPSSIIEKNLSHETFICTQEDIDEKPDDYLWLENVPHNIISYDDYVYEMKGKTVHKSKADTITTCYFSKPKDKKKGIIPTILETLLNERKKTRKRIKETDNEDKKKVLDGLQLAYKVTANSVYGQMGAKTSAICFKKIAACTTSIGRQRIYDAREGVKEWAIAENYYPPDVVYGDTDSVFVKFSRKHKDTGEILKDKEALQYCIDCGIKAGEWITKHKMNPDWDSESFGKGPQDLEYEKTFYPFILISKKRYTGDKYEESANKLKERTSMGIVMKRRDNAPIVKYVFGNVIEIIMNQKSVSLAMDWLKKTLQEIKDGKIDKSMFIISKSLSAYYKNPEGIAHKVLADRMAERNPGNKPKPNDRIPYMYQVVDETPIITGHKMISKKVENGKFKNGKTKYKTIKVQGPPKLKKRNILQGDRIEHPDFMEEKKIPIDYSFYISNQIMNPVKQVLDLEKNEKETEELFKPFI